MTIVKRSNQYSPSFPSLFDNFFSRDWMDWNNLNFSNTDTTIPAVNVKEDVDKFEIEVASPGMTKDDFKVKLENNLLSISSELRKEHKESKGNYNRKEFSYQSFHRSFNLPEGHIQSENITAKYENGILFIELPKREEVKPLPPKEIHIN
ncbi:MAG: Hsp20/alpha crystallin family protein [Prolixibacteraceae bacterium]